MVFSYPIAVFLNTIIITILNFFGETVVVPYLFLIQGKSIN